MPNINGTVRAEPKGHVRIVTREVATPPPAAPVDVESGAAGAACSSRTCLLRCTFVSLLATSLVGGSIVLVWYLTADAQER